MFTDMDLSTVYNDKNVYIQHVYVIKYYLYTQRHILNHGSDGILEHGLRNIFVLRMILIPFWFFQNKAKNAEKFSS